MDTVKVRITGKTPLLMHSSQLANPFNKYAKQLADLNTQKKRKGVDKLEMLAKMADVEWEGGLYFDDKLGPIIPAEVVRANILAGARLTRGGKSAERGIFIPCAAFKLEYDGSRDLETLKKDENFRDQRMVSVQQSKVLRTRPKFNEWAVTIEVGFDEATIAREDLLRYIHDGGTIGYGDALSLGFGKFSAKELTATTAKVVDNGQVAHAK
jgi:hypothetical protein